MDPFLGIFPNARYGIEASGPRVANAGSPDALGFDFGPEGVPSGMTGGWDAGALTVSRAGALEREVGPPFGLHGQTTAPAPVRVPWWALGLGLFLLMGRR